MKHSRTLIQVQNVAKNLKEVGISNAWIGKYPFLAHVDPIPIVVEARQIDVIGALSQNLLF